MNVTTLGFRYSTLSNVGNAVCAGAAVAAVDSSQYTLTHSHQAISLWEFFFRAGVIEATLNSVLFQTRIIAGVLAAKFDPASKTTGPLQTGAPETVTVARHQEVSITLLTSEREPEPTEA